MRRAFLVLLITICTHAESFAILNAGANEYEIIFAYRTNYNLTIDEFLKLKPSDFKSLARKKLSLREVLTLKFTLANIKSSKRKNRIIDKLTFNNPDKKPFKWHWGGFFLGLLLPFGIGMIISSLKKNERKKDRVTSAAIGTLITSIVIIILALSSW